ncbi:hypothetical protein [Bacillus sp. 2205SS5-2]|uniref:hypothetical protein n=1 Tax=Bacillus sp. 2205SS5-2 TaxID=3109031 RepID=UPI003005FC2B
MEWVYSILYIFYVLLFIGVFIQVIYYRYQLRSSVYLTKQAIFPMEQAQYETIRIAPEWNAMQPFTSTSKRYKWINIITLLILAFVGFLGYFVFIDQAIQEQFILVIYLLASVPGWMKQPGNIYIVKKGVILHGLFYRWSEVKSYEVEKVVKWHSLYGYHEKVNNGYLLKVRIKRKWLQPEAVVFSDKKRLDEALSYFHQQEIVKKIKEEKKVRNY